MLAKKIVIRTMKQQRDFIYEQLNSIPEARTDGCHDYPYIGDIYPENIKYFEHEGFVITPVKSDLLLAMTKGVPVYLFTISKDIKLSEAELEQAENYQYKTADTNYGADTLDSLIEKFLGRNIGEF